MPLELSIQTTPSNDHQGKLDDRDFVDSWLRTAKDHDFNDYMSQASQRMRDEYNRIQKRVNQDPGTAGDEGENNWAEFLQGYFPGYKVVTKGRILYSVGVTSPQIDVLILHPSYPSELLGRKMYLAGGVVAAFECKLTLKREHIEDAVKTAVLINYFDNTKLESQQTPYKILNGRIVYGLLAHSHVWKENPIEKISDLIKDFEYSHVKHPRELLDIICVADLATWSVSKRTKHDNTTRDWYYLPMKVEGYKENNIFLPPYETITTCYWCTEENEEGRSTAIGAALVDLTKRIAWRDSSLRTHAVNLELIKSNTVRRGRDRYWSAEIYPEYIRNIVFDQHLPSNWGFGCDWNEWSEVFP